MAINKVKRSKVAKTATPKKSTITVGKPIAPGKNVVTVFGIPFEQGGDSYTFGKCRYVRPVYAYDDGYGLGGIAPVGGAADANVWNFIRFDDSKNPTRRPNAQNGYVIFRRHPQDGYVDAQFVNDVNWGTTYQVIEDADLSSL